MCLNGWSFLTLLFLQVRGCIRVLQTQSRVIELINLPSFADETSSECLPTADAMFGRAAPLGAAHTTLALLPHTRAHSRAHAALGSIGGALGARRRAGIVAFPPSSTAAWWGRSTRAERMAALYALRQHLRAPDLGGVSVRHFLPPQPTTGSVRTSRGVSVTSTRPVSRDEPMQLTDDAQFGGGGDRCTVDGGTLAAVDESTAMHVPPGSVGDDADRVLRATSPLTSPSLLEPDHATGSAPSAGAADDDSLCLLTEFHELRVRTVRFAYEPGGPLALDIQPPPHVVDALGAAGAATNPLWAEHTPLSSDLHLVPGKVYGLCGQNRSGKSTLVQLLCRLFHPSDADAARTQIAFNGRVPLHRVARASLRQIISYVAQRPFIFPGTIAENIRMARPEASDWEVECAAEAAGCFIFEAPRPLVAATTTTSDSENGAATAAASELDFDMVKPAPVTAAAASSAAAPSTSAAASATAVAPSASKTTPPLKPWEMQKRWWLQVWPVTVIAPHIHTWCATFSASRYCSEVEIFSLQALLF